MASEAEVELVVVRHGETESNRSHTIQGHRDTALSDLGVRQAECAAKYLGEDLRVMSHNCCVHIINTFKHYHYQ